MSDEAAMTHSLATTTPAEQALLFAERARAAGRAVGALVFEGADHGTGGVNCAAGRSAVLRFLKQHGLRGVGLEADSVGESHVEAATRVFGTGGVEYSSAPLEGKDGQWLVEGRATVSLPPAAPADKKMI